MIPAPSHTRRALALLGLALGCLAGACSRGPRPPSVLLVTLDTTRADHLSCYGYGKVTSPELDRLAADGVLYTNAYAVTSWTLPSHASLFTGKLPSSHGAKYDPEGVLKLSQGIGGPWDRYAANPMSYEETTLAQVLKDRGYATGAVVAGPWLKRVFGLSKGFDSYDDEGFRDDPQRGQLGGRPGEDVTRAAIEFVEEHEDEPFFLFLNYYDAHQPLAPPPEYARRFWSGPAPEQGTPEWTRFNLAIYDAAIQYMDHEFGRLLRRMKELGVYEDTWIIVLADHGELYGENDTWGHGDSLSQPEIHVPLIVKEPGPDRPRGVDEAPVQQTDVMPLLLQRLGIPLPRDVQGQPIGHVDHPIVAEVYPLPFMNELHAGKPRQLGDFKSIVEGKWKYVWSSRGYNQLYDLETDPLEAENVLSLHPDVAARLQERLDRYMESLPPPLGARGEVRNVGKDVLEDLNDAGYVGGDTDH